MERIVKNLRNLKKFIKMKFQLDKIQKFEIQHLKGNLIDLEDMSDESVEEEEDKDEMS